MSKIAEVRREFGWAFSKLDELIEKLEEDAGAIKREFEEKLESFFEEPYAVLLKSKDEYYVVVPKFVDFHAGWLEHETKSYRVFVVNRYMRWITPIPPSPASA